MDILSYKSLKNYDGHLLKEGTERVLQIGEGNFLRGFVDYFFDCMNEKLGLDTKVVVVQPLNFGLAKKINEQDGLYRVYLRGSENDKPIVKRRLVSSISRCINAYEEFPEFLKNAQNKDLRFIISNTTEAGISCLADDEFSDAPPSSYPAKLTRFLWERYQIFGKEKGKGFIIIACELIDNSGKELKRCVETYAKRWELPEEFLVWLESENTFCNTLVDRIITGYPAQEADEINAQNDDIDQLIVTGEPFAFWAIEGPEWLKEELPFEKAGLPVYIVPDQTPFKKRKVHILNGAQTGISLPAYLMGYDISLQYMADPHCVDFVKGIMYDEILPYLHMDKQSLLEFADECMVRLDNPFIKHKLIDISLNSVPKWKARDFPCIKSYYKENGYLPKKLVFTLAALLAFYNIREKNEKGYFGVRDGIPYQIRDDAFTLEFFYEHRDDTSEELVKAYFADGRFIDDFEDIDGLIEMTIEVLADIRKNGIKEVLYNL